MKKFLMFMCIVLVFITGVVITTTRSFAHEKPPTVKTCPRGMQMYGGVCK